MSQEIIQALPQLAALVERGGIVGLLLIAVAYLIWERMRLMKDNRRVYKQRDRARMITERYRGALVAAAIPVPDIADIIVLFGEAEE